MVEKLRVPIDSIYLEPIWEVDTGHFPIAYKKFLSLQKEVTFRYVSIHTNIWTEVYIVEKSVDSGYWIRIEAWGPKNEPA